MGNFADQLRRFDRGTVEHVENIETGVVTAVGEEVIALSPVGDPALWKSPPPADYVPGNFRSSWFYSQGAPSDARTSRTDVTTINGLGDLTGGGRKHFLTNNAPHSTAIEHGHSSQAPVGILSPVEASFENLATEVAQRVRR